MNDLALQSWMEVFLMVRRRRSTMFLVAREGDTVAEVRRMVAGLCGQQAASVRLFLQENPEKGDQPDQPDQLDQLQGGPVFWLHQISLKWQVR